MSIVYTYPRMTRLVVVAAVLGLSVGAALRPSILWLVAIAGPAGALLLLRWPNLGFVALPLAGLVVPFRIGTGTETNLNASVLLVATLLGLWLLRGLLSPTPIGRLARPFLPLTLLVATAVLATVAGLQPWLPFAITASIASQLGGLSLFILSAGAFLLAAYRVDDLRYLRALTWTFVGASAGLVAGRLLQPLGQILNPIYQPDADGGMFWTWLAAISFSQSLLNQRLRLLWRLGLFGIAMASAYLCLTVTREWVSGWLPLVVALGATFCLAKPRFGAPIALLAALAISQGALGLTTAVSTSDNAYSFDTRVAAWVTLGEVIKESPVIGLGPANYYFYTPLLTIMGYNVRFNSHNNYVDLVAQTGVLGLLCFLWFAAEIGWLGWSLRDRVASGFERAYVNGALGGLAATLVAMMLGDWVIPFVYNVGFAGFRASVLPWLFLGGLIALQRLSRAASTSRESSRVET